MLTLTDPNQDSVMLLPSMATLCWFSVVTLWIKQFRTICLRSTCRQWNGQTTVLKHLCNLLPTWLIQSYWTPWNLQSSEDWRRTQPAILRHQMRFYSWTWSRWSGKSQEKSLLRQFSMFRKNEWAQRLSSMVISYGSTVAHSLLQMTILLSKRSPISSPSTLSRDYGKKK